jgi:glycosyltransferase involved in cell wall biosynthesis
MNPTTGGPCQGIRISTKELEKYGIYREAVTLDDPSSEFLGKDNFLIHALGPGITAWCYNSQLLPWLLLNLQRFDIVIVNGLWQYHGYALYKALQILKKDATNKVPGYFVMPHGMLDPYFQKARHRTIKAIRNWFYWKLIESKLVNNARGLLFTCETEMELARTTFRPYSPQKEYNVGYGTPEPPTYSDKMQKAFLEKCPQCEGKPYLLFLSRIHHKKGVDILIKAYREIQNEKLKIKNELPILVIAGPGLETKYGKKIKKMVDNDALAKDKIFFTGMLTGDAKLGAIYGCEAFILPSHQENFGIAVVEALACAKPVLISTEVNIWKEIIFNGAGIVGGDTVAGVKEILQHWINLSQPEKQIMAKNAKKTFENCFEISQVSKSFLEAIG